MNDDSRHPHVFWVYLLIAAVIVGWIGVRTQLTADRLEQESRHSTAFTAQTQKCVHDLVNVLHQRAAITENSDRLNNEQYRIFRDMMIELSRVNTAQERGVVMNRWVPQIVEAQQRQATLIQSRADHPLPNPDCAIS